MYRSLVAFLATALFTSSAFAASIGEPAPAFTGTDALSGKTIGNDSFKGHIAVLEWNNWECPFVHKFYDSGAMQKLQAQAKKDDVVWVTINSNAPGKEGFLKDAATAQAAAKEHKSNAAAYLLDPEGTIGHAYGAKSTPTMVVIGKDGKLTYEGAIDSIPSPYPQDIAKADNYVTDAITALKAGKQPKVTTTQSYGCFVKY